VLFLLVVALVHPVYAGPKDKEKLREQVQAEADRGPAASASEIPALARLLEKAGWTPTPEMSGIFEPGIVFTDSGFSHSVLTSTCFQTSARESSYTSAEVITQLQAGVSVGVAGLGRASVEGELVKKVKFGAPVHASVDRLALVPLDTCSGQLGSLPPSTIDASYVVQEVLLAEIAEQTCGRVDASGRFVGLGSAEASLASACAQASLEPVAVGYRTVPLRELVGTIGGVSMGSSGGVSSSGGGSGGGSFGDTTELAARIAATEALKAKLESERAACVDDEEAAVRVAARTDWQTLGALRDLAATSDEARAAAAERIETFVGLYDGRQVACRNDLGELSRAVTPAEVAEARAWLARPSGVWTGASGYRMVAIAAGTFTMGSPASEPDRNDDEVQHQVRLTRGYLLGETEVTQGLWRSVMGSNPSAEEEYKGVSPVGDDLPVQNVSWCDAVAFANALSRQDGLAAAYTGTERCDGTKGDSVRWDPNATGYRLPTEAEWEHAARAGEHRLFAGAESYAAVCAVANVADLGAAQRFGLSADASRQCTDGDAGLARVGSYAANAWGLYDLTGNVWEWCWDVDGGYGTGLSVDPTGSQSGSFRVSRGGSWGSYPRGGRVANRRWITPVIRDGNLGLRLARTIP
jgi:formylglycine-generating enzyme required for sulfatase activity